jgi:peptidoglycan/LPS O-acetylase OafA/YrhL
MVNAPKQDRFEFIDALRGIAAFSVLLLHVAFFHSKIVRVPRWAGPVVQNGGMGVTLFFVVSAFCLCLTMRKHNNETNSTLKFYLRRIFRIVPLFYLVLLIRLPIGGSYDVIDVLRNVFFIFNFFPGKEDGIVWASWTLGVEMAFYLLFPIIFLFANNFRKSLVFLGITLAISAGFTAGIQNINPPILKDSFYYHSFFRVLPIFAIGIVTYFTYEEFIRGKKLSRLFAFILLSVAVSAYFILWIKNMHALANGVVMRSLVCSVFLLGLSISPLGIIVNIVSRFLGKISYSFYLFHPIIVYFLKPVYQKIYNIELSVSLQYGLCLLLAVVPLTVIAYLSFRFIEQPGMRLGNILIKRISPINPPSSLASNHNTH